MKEKRRRLKPFIARLHKEFNISIAELDHNDRWQEAIIGCALVSNSQVHTRRALQKIPPWIETYWPDLVVLDDEIELA